MATYKVFLRGENFWLRPDGEKAHLGFHTTRFVDAGTPDAAELASVDGVRTELNDRVLHERTDLPMIYADEIDPSQVPTPRPSGFTFFPHDKQNRPPNPPLEPMMRLLRSDFLCSNGSAAQS